MIFRQRYSQKTPGKMAGTCFIFWIFSVTILEYVYCFECEQFGKINCERIQHIIAKKCSSEESVKSIEEACIDLSYKKTVNCIRAHCSNTLTIFPIKSQSAVKSNVSSVLNNTVTDMYRDMCADCMVNFNNDESMCPSECAASARGAGVCKCSWLFVFIILILRLLLFFNNVNYRSIIG